MCIIYIHLSLNEYETECHLCQASYSSVWCMYVSQMEANRSMASICDPYEYVSNITIR